MNKQKIIQISTVIGKICGVLITVLGDPNITGLIPAKYTAIGLLILGFSSTFKEFLTSMGWYVEGPAALQSEKVQVALPIAVDTKNLQAQVNVLTAAVGK